jgi:diphosphomevalonate decarboxylase
MIVPGLVAGPVRGCTAAAGTNIALVKYWGKRDTALNLPATGSLSLTLQEMGTRTTVRFGSVEDDGDRDADRVTFNGAPASDRVRARISAFLDRVRARAGITQRAEVITENSVPTAAGLASSASGFAALALAASRAAGLRLTPTELSELARLGSGSAARSIFGGFVEMARGVRADGRDAVAAPVASDVASEAAWDLRLVVAVTAVGEKALGSTAAMDSTARTSPFYAAWVASSAGDLAEARAAIGARDLGRLGTVAERSALRMHATAMAAEPAILYWNAATLAAIHETRALRARGLAAYFTIDAGPHVKVLCAAVDAPPIAAALADVPGVLRTLIASPGPGARVVPDQAPEHEPQKDQQPRQPRPHGAEEEGVA